MNKAQELPILLRIIFIFIYYLPKPTKPKISGPQLQICSHFQLFCLLNEQDYFSSVTVLHQLFLLCERVFPRMLAWLTSVVTNVLGDTSCYQRNILWLASDY